MTKRLYIDFHVIQTVPPSCVNRDDTGRPKTAVYGGVNRARVSSQSWKHAVREYFKGTFENGFRTKYMKQLILDTVKVLSPEYTSGVYFHLLYYYNPDKSIPKGHHLSIIFYATFQDKSKLDGIREFLTTSVLSNYYDFFVMKLPEVFQLKRKNFRMAQPCHFSG